MEKPFRKNSERSYCEMANEENILKDCIDTDSDW